MVSPRQPLVLFLAVLALGAGCRAEPGSPGGSELGERPFDAIGPAETEGSVEACRPGALTHAYGTARLDRVPTRVVSLSIRDQEAALALGVRPVAVRDGYYETPWPERPWVRDRLGDATPAVLSAREIDFERVASLRPDLILAVDAGLTRTEYRVLSRIAPTLAQPAGFPDFGVPWRETLARVAETLCRGDLAREIVAELDRALAGARAALGTRLAGTGGSEGDDGGSGGADGGSGRAEPGARADDADPGDARAMGRAVVAMPGGPEGTFWVYGEADSRSRFLAELGFAVPAEVDRLVRDRFTAPVSAERFDLLDVDRVVWIAGAAQRAALEDDPIYRAVRGTADGALFLEPAGLATAAMTNVTALSIPYLLEEVLPRLAEPGARG